MLAVSSAARMALPRLSTVLKGMGIIPLIPPHTAINACTTQLSRSILHSTTTIAIDWASCSDRPCRSLSMHVSPCLHSVHSPLTSSSSSIPRDTTHGPVLFQNAHRFALSFVPTPSNAVAIIDALGSYSYYDLLADSKALAQVLFLCRCKHQQRPAKSSVVSHTNRMDKPWSPEEANKMDLQEDRVLYLFPRDYTYTVAQWAIWRAGGIAVPLSAHASPTELEYFMDDATPSLVVVHKDFEATLKPLCEKRKLPYIVVDSKRKPSPYTRLGFSCDLLSSHEIFTSVSDSDVSMPAISDMERGALIVYTSGTTGKPKGVVSSHNNIQAQAQALVQAWGWTAADHILHVLPLHHVHGIVNVLTCALMSGAVCEMFPDFKVDKVWEALSRQSTSSATVTSSPSPVAPPPTGSRSSEDAPTLFMAVPTIYAKLIEFYDRLPKEKQLELSQRVAPKPHGQSNIRLMVSGSAALPPSVLTKWREITKHTLLERYGMTEFGMALSNPLHGQRIQAAVGQPLPGVECKVVSLSDSKSSEDVVEEGELWVRGNNVFKGYWNRPEATKATFAEGGWFKTGDVVMVKDGVYYIKGRLSSDIIKSAGYKISALDIESVLLTHPQIKECAVVGLPDAVYGEKVAAVVALNGSPTPQVNNSANSSTLTLEELRKFASTQLAKYKLPTVLKIVPAVPRNALGKVNKKALVAQLFPQAPEP